MTREEVLSRFPEGSVYYLPLLLAMELHLSKAEVFGLCWTDIDFATNYVTVSYEAHYDRETNQIIFSEKDQTRYVKLTKIASNALKRAKKQTQRRSNMRYLINSSGVLTGPYTFYRAHLNTVLPICTRDNGSYISPLGINYVALVLQGKKGHFVNPDPKWKWKDLFAINSDC